MRGGMSNEQCVGGAAGLYEWCAWCGGSEVAAVRVVLPVDTKRVPLKTVLPAAAAHAARPCSTA